MMGVSNGCGLCPWSCSGKLEPMSIVPESSSIAQMEVRHKHKLEFQSIILYLDVYWMWQYRYCPKVGVVCKCLCTFILFSTLFRSLL